MKALKYGSIALATIIVSGFLFVGAVVLLINALPPSLH